MFLLVVWHGRRRLAAAVADQLWVATVATGQNGGAELGKSTRGLRVRCSVRFCFSTSYHYVPHSAATCRTVRRPHESGCHVVPTATGVALALQHALALQVADDLAHHRLRPVQVRRRLADGERPGMGQMLKDRQ